MDPENTCSVSSLLAGEPLAGTAVAGRWRWLGLEYRPAWAAQGVEQAALPPAARAFVDDFAARPGHRVQLLRRPDRKAGPLAVQIADLRAGTVREGAVDRYEDLPSLDLDDLPLARGPVVWVCTHGQRDRCCGVDGGRVFTAARRAMGDGAWQTSHLGGHRFAPTLLALPQGVCYGRVGPDEVDALLDALGRGELHRLDTVRGRVGWSRDAQAAEVEVRRALGDDRSAAVELVSEGGGRVTLRARGRAFQVTVDRVPLDRPVVSSCGKTPGPGVALVPRIA